MKTEKIQTPSPNFKHWNREVYKKSVIIDRLKHRNDTSFFRDYDFWADLLMIMMSKYKSVPKVNVYSYGCSDGSEAYSFLMTILSNLGVEEATKFLPVIAKDYDSEAIERARQNRYKINDLEHLYINKFTDSHMDIYFEDIANQYDLNKYYRAKSILTDNVEFSTGNILTDYINIEPENSIVLARNFWPYLNKKDAKVLARNLYHRLQKNSFLAVGTFDLKYEYIRSYLYDAGFETSPYWAEGIYSCNKNK